MTKELEIALSQARTLPAEELPEFLGELEQVRVTAMARLSAPAPAQTQTDELLDVKEASRCLGVSKDYLYHHHRKFPFSRRVGRKLLFSSLGIGQYLRQRH